MEAVKSIDLPAYLPTNELDIEGVNNTQTSVIIKLKSKTKSCILRLPMISTS